jgi:hypothetical protein
MAIIGIRRRGRPVTDRTIQLHMRARVKRLTSELYWDKGLIDHHQFKRLREMSKSTEEDLMMAVETIKALCAANNLPADFRYYG